MKVVNIYRDKYDVYIGRRGKGQDGYFGNPIAKGRPCPLCKVEHQEVKIRLSCYSTYIRTRIKKDLEFRSRVKELYGKTLGCFCKPKPCHGDILIEICRELNRE